MFTLIPPVISRPMRMIVMSWGIYGFFVIVSFFLGDPGSPALDVTPWYLEVVFAILVMMGTVSIQLSSLPWKLQNTTWKLESLGWPPLMAAWTIFVSSALSPPHVQIFPAILGLGALACSIYRLVEVSLFMRLNRQEWEDMKNGFPDA